MCEGKTVSNASIQRFAPLGILCGLGIKCSNHTLGFFARHVKKAKRSAYLIAGETNHSQGYERSSSFNYMYAHWDGKVYPRVMAQAKRCGSI